MARGELVPDDVVVGIISDRIDAAGRGATASCSTAFRAPSRRRRRSTGCSPRKASSSTAVIELKVDEGILLRADRRAGSPRCRRGESRCAPTTIPEAFKTRLAAYREQTAPLIDYYRAKGTLQTVDGMAAIDEVTRSIDAALAEWTARLCGDGG